MTTLSRGDIRIKGFSDVEMEFQLIRQMGASVSRAASIGECLTIANKLQSSSPKQWVNEFEALGEWQKKDGLARMVKGHVISGREQLFRACSSYRAAEYYSPCSSEHHRILGLNSADCFCSALSSMDLHFENHSVSYKNINLPVYFVSPANDGEKRKTLLIVSGFDGTLEEEFLLRGLAAVERGYNVIHFAGPGQMDVFRNHPGTYFEPDFENVVRKIINHFEFRHEIDKHHLSLMGISIGGYFAIRGACHEHRIKALIANSPILNLYSYLCSFASVAPEQIPDSEDFEVNDIASMPDDVLSEQMKIQAEQLITRFGQQTFKRTFDYIKQFQIDDSIQQLNIPCLALIGSGEGSEPHQQFDDFCTLTQADRYEFSDFEGAGAHCQVGNSSFANAVTYDWLDSI